MFPDVSRNAMSEKLCLQWNDFKDSAINAFGNLRDDKDFADVTLVCEDGKQMEVHKVVLASSSPFFQNILKRIKHSHPLIYMRGMKSDELSAIVDFLYFGEANIQQEKLDSFLAIAEELQLKGLMGRDDQPEVLQKEIHKRHQAKTLPEEKTVYKREMVLPRSAPQSNASEEILSHDPEIFSGTMVATTTSQYSEELQELLQESEPMMEKTERKMPNGKRSYNCIICGKEGEKGNIRQHIEANHLEGVSVPCKFCEKTFRSRNALNSHNFKFHRTQKY